MKYHIVRDSEKAIIGILIVTGCYIGEDYFVKSLPANHAKGEVSISMLSEGDGIFITNGPHEPVSFKINPEELHILRDYIESNETQINIMHDGNFDLIARILFINEKIRKESIIGA